MTESADFLSRWSRRKREAAKAESESNAVDSDTAPEPATNDETPAAVRDKDESGAETGTEPAFDLTKLPSIESITAETDIRPFLARGVPSALRQAALRRMWSVDPAIRDFIEMAENQWDFNAPGAVPGFDLAAPTGDLKRMVADILGDKLPGDMPSQVQPDAEEADVPAPPGAVAGLDTPQQESPAVRPTLVMQHGEPEDRDAAMQQDAALQEDSPKLLRRTHGGALPR